jgi:hypothetical protein
MRNGGGASRLKIIAVLGAASMVLAGCGQKAVPGPGGGGSNPNPVKAGPGQKVHLIWKKHDNKWMVKLNDGPEENPTTAKTELKQGLGPTMFEVDIQGDTDAAFKDIDGFIVWEGQKKAVKSGSTQILGPVLIYDKNNRATKLFFFDLNQGNAVTLYYGFNFDDGTSVDPIIDNGGGTNLQ